MREHIAGLESELATDVDRLAQLQASRATFFKRAEAALASEDHRVAHAVLVESIRNADADNDEVGAVKADIHVLRAILAECYDWLHHFAGDAGAADSTSTSPPTSG
jgi:Tfp pilus assembly protein PilX